jgi:hypothetical protein
MLAAMGVALAFGYASSWLMACLGLTIRNTEAIRAAIYTVVFPMALTSSVFLPTQTMPGWLQAFAEHQPITMIANALCGLILGQGALPPATPSPAKPSSSSPGPSASSPPSHPWPYAHIGTANDTGQRLRGARREVPASRCSTVVRAQR